jgi:hypothetical protein
MNRIKYITRTGLVKKRLSSLTGKTVYNDDMTYALHLGKSTLNQRGVRMYSVKSVRCVTTPIYGHQGKKIVKRLFPKGHEFVHPIIENGEIPEHFISQIFPHVYDGSLKQFEESIK